MRRHRAEARLPGEGLSDRAPQGESGKRGGRQGNEPRHRDEAKTDMTLGGHQQRHDSE